MSEIQPAEPPKKTDRPHYLEEDEQAAWSARVHAEHRRERQAARDRVAGPLWIIAGTMLTLWSLSAGGTIAVIAWGPVVYGIYRCWQGYRSGR